LLAAQRLYKSWWLLEISKCARFWAGLQSITYTPALLSCYLSERSLQMLVDFSIMPVGKGESLSKDVAEAVRLIIDSRLPYKVGPMATSIEGSWDQVMDLTKRAKDRMLETCNRVIITIKIDERKDAKDRLIGKLKSVEKQLGTSLQ
jgi:uncharacterized protein (TIGR00106 family)